MPFNPLFPQAPFYGSGAVRASFGTYLPPGARVVYLRSTGVSITDPPEITRTNLVQTLAAALLQCRGGFGDVVYVLPGHSENVTTTPVFPAGVRIVGIGNGSNMPVFRWTATTSQWAIAANDVVISGLRLRMEGANGVVKAILVTGSDVSMNQVDIEMSSGASNKAVIGIEVGAGATRFSLTDFRMRGVAAGVVTDPIKIVAAVDGVEIARGKGFAAGTAATGLIHVTAAATTLDFADLDLYNLTAASTATVSVDNVAADGYFRRIRSAVLTNGTITAEGIIFTGASAQLIQCAQCSASDLKQTNDAVSPVAST